MVLSSGDTLPPKDEQFLPEEHLIRDELRKARASIDNYDRALRKRTNELRQASKLIVDLQHENQRLKDIITGSNLQDVHQKPDPKTLSDVSGPQVFSTKVDTLSIPEVGERVTALNEEIFQVAATLGESLIHKRYELPQTELEEAAAISQELVGEKLTNTLFSQSKKPEPDVNPLLVQVVLQIFMVNFCVSKIQSWYPGDSTIGDLLSAIYTDIRFAEEQAVSGRWRAVTRANTRPNTETWNNELYKKLQSVLIIASWTTRSSENEDFLGNRLPSFFKAINELRMAIGENFTSADLDIFTFDCDKNYDPAIMEDAYGDGRQSNGKRPMEVIVGTTGIGLGKVIAVMEDVIRMHPLIPAKIVLRSTLNEALEPKRSTSSKKKTPVETMDGSIQDGRD